jgi:polyisoprenoid-binding protein YceI
MKKIISVCFLTCFIAATAFSQNYITRNGNIAIYSHTPLEDVKAQNNEVASVLNGATGDLEFKLAVKSFHFEKTAMEDHFNNDDYMASGKYPKAGFKGKITNISSADLTKDGKYNVTASGDLTIRDVTKPVTATGTLTVSNGKVTLASTFTIKRKEYNVIGESFVQKKISEDIQITVNCQYDK